jgi:hypothetical protein
MTTLSPEVVRSDSDLHIIYEGKMTKITSLIDNGLADGSKLEKISRAWAVSGILISGLTMARAVNSDKIANQINKSICSSPISAAGEVNSTLTG